MMAYDEDALICDLAETYGIFDWTSMPVSTIATLAVGLGDNSRIKKKIRGDVAKEPPLDLDTILLARILDATNLLVWSRTKDAAKGRNKPDSVLDALLGKNKKTKDKEHDKPQAFETPEDFSAAWKKLGGGGVG